MFLEGFSSLQRELLLSIPSIARQLGISADDRSVEALDVNQQQALNLGHRIARSLRFTVPESAVAPVPLQFISADFDIAIQKLHLPLGAVDVLKFGLLDSLCLANSAEPILHTGRCDLWSKFWSRATSSVLAGSSIGGWISIAGCFGGEGVCLDNFQSVLLKRTFGKVKGIACIHGRSPVILIQLAHFDSVASNSAIGGFKAHRFTLIDRFQSVVVRDSATIRGEVFVHDCHAAKLGIDSVGCARDEIATSSPLFQSRRRGWRWPVASVRHCALQVYMRFDVLGSSNTK